MLNVEGNVHYPPAAENGDAAEQAGGAQCGSKDGGEDGSARQRQQRWRWRDWQRTVRAQTAAVTKAVTMIAELRQRAPLLGYPGALRHPGMI